MPHISSHCEDHRAGIWPEAFSSLILSRLSLTRHTWLCVAGSDRGITLTPVLRLNLTGVFISSNPYMSAACSRVITDVDIFLTDGRLQLRSSAAHTLLPDKAPFRALIGSCPHILSGHRTSSCSLVFHYARMVQLHKVQAVYFYGGQTPLITYDSLTKCRKYWLLMLFLQHVKYFHCFGDLYMQRSNNLARGLEVKLLCSSCSCCLLNFSDAGNENRCVVFLSSPIFSRCLCDSAPSGNVLLVSKTSCIYMETFSNDIGVFGHELNNSWSIYLLH